MTPTSTLRKYRIPPGKSINVSPASRLKGEPFTLLTGPLPSGRVVTSDDVPEGKIASYVKSGFLIPLGEATPDATGIEAAVLGNDSVRENAGHQATMPLTKPEEVGMKPVKDSRIVHRTQWDTAPHKLEGKSLEVLNLMVKERDPRVAPFETVEEAMAQLTKDYKGPKG